VTQKELLNQIKELTLKLLDSTRHYDAIEKLTQALARIRQCEANLDEDWFYSEHVPSAKEKLK
jgi:fructose-1,6-bisphosphatase/sedoheptulose 1,7-bisphosphatase-like protein